MSFYKFESHFPFHYALLRALGSSAFCSDEDAANIELSKEDTMVQHRIPDVRKMPALVRNSNHD
jgi:hypothetical protein